MWKPQYYSDENYFQATIVNTENVNEYEWYPTKNDAILGAMRRNLAEKLNERKDTDSHN